jgi:hypothetical protein
MHVQMGTTWLAVLGIFGIFDPHFLYAEHGEGCSIVISLAEHVTGIDIH